MIKKILACTTAAAMLLTSTANAMLWTNTNIPCLQEDLFDVDKFYNGPYITIKNEGGYTKQDIGIYVNGTKVKTEVAPVMVNDRVMVPLRAVLESEDIYVDYDEDTKIVSAEYHSSNLFPNTELFIKAGEDFATVNGEKVALDSPAVVIDGRTLVPLRVCSEAFGFKVDWMEDENAVILTRKRVPLKNSAMVEKSFERTYDEYGNKLDQQDVGYPYSMGLKCEYDKFGRLTKKIVTSYNESNGEHRPIEFLIEDITYDEYGNVIKKYKGRQLTNYLWSDKDGDGWLDHVDTGDFESDDYDFGLDMDDSPGYYDEYEYNNNGNITHYSKGGYKSSESEYKYDDSGRLIYWEETGDNWKKWKKFEYNSDGQIIAASDSDGSQKKFQYNSDGKIIYSEDNGEWTKYAYTDDGTVTITRKSGEWENGKYDKNGLIHLENSNGYREDTIFDEVTGEYIERNWSYADGDTFKWKDGEFYRNGELLEKYNDFGMPLYMDDEDENIRIEYEYDETGRLVTERQSDGQVITHEYGDKTETVRYYKYDREINIEIFKYFMN